MKKVLSILVVAMFATAVMSCSKDKDDESTLNIPDNTLVYDGTSYTFDEVVVDYYHQALTLVSAYTSEMQQGTEDPMLAIDGIHITPNMWNKTFDLTSQASWPDEVSVYMILNGVLDISFEGWVNGDRDISGHIDDVDYEHESIFTSGTYRVSGNNDGTPITVTIDGVLKNGKKLQIKLVTDSYNVH